MWFCFVPLPRVGKETGVLFLAAFSFSCVEVDFFERAPCEDGVEDEEQKAV